MSSCWEQNEDIVNMPGMRLWRLTKKPSRQDDKDDIGRLKNCDKI